MLNQRLMATAVICKGNKYLMLRRSLHEKLWAGSWQFPEGGVDFGEAPEQALSRELKEETGLRLNNAKLVGTSSSTLRYFGKSVYHVVRLLYLCRTSGKLRLSNAHDNFAWLNKNQIDKLRLMEGLRWAHIRGII